MCLCVCVCVCVCQMHTHARILIHTQYPHAKYAKAHTHTHTCTRARARTHTHTHMNTHTCTRTASQMHVESEQQFSYQKRFRSKIDKEFVGFRNHEPPTSNHAQILTFEARKGKTRQEHTPPRPIRWWNSAETTTEKPKTKPKTRTRTKTKPHVPLSSFFWLALAVPRRLAQTLPQTFFGLI